MNPPDLACIVAATDLSDNATPAVRRAADLARSHGSALHIVHVVDPAVDDFPVDQTLEVLQHQTLDLEPTATLAAREGHPFVEIARYATEVNAALVVVGARGRHSVLERVLGTTAERVVRHGHRPVLVVRSVPRSPMYERVLVGIDLSDPSVQALRFARRAFPDAHITAINVCVVIGERRLRMSGATDEDLEALRLSAVSSSTVALETWLEQHHLDVDDRRVVAGWPTHDLLVLADAFDLTVVASKGMSGIGYVLLGSVAQQVLREGTRDVLVVHADTSDLQAPSQS